MFFALMAIDGRGFSVNSDRARLVILGIFKNDQAQVDKYLEMLNPLLRRTTEGSVETISHAGNVSNGPHSTLCNEFMRHY